MTDDAPPASDSVKRPTSPDNAKTPPAKKVRLGFSGKDFRQQLKGDQKAQALQRFLDLTSEESQQCVQTYLEDGGSPLEILQTVEGESGAPPVVVFDAVNRVLLQISAKLSRFQSAAFDACKYLLNSYLSQINKMLGLSSSKSERIVVLKLLTTMVTCSVTLAKDVLLNVNFNPTNLQLLTKVTEGKNEARRVFIFFLTAFLVDGHFSPLSVLLEKRGLMTSIISGLKYDKADVVVLVVTAMKNHILENTFVSKSVKMKTFNTAVVRDIVNLYNWKGPAGIPNPKNKKKMVNVDEIDKSKVNEAVHSFLLVLCTSHKLGIIFKDPLVGLGKHQNVLMFTVLDSLVRPWEHSYASELVLKIAKSCPDLARVVWNSLKESLKPRWTEKWFKTVQFAGQLVEGFHPECVEFAVENLNSQQVVQLITTLTSPFSILKILLPEGHNFDTPATRHYILLLLLKMAKQVEMFLERAKSWPIDYPHVRTALLNHFYRNFPKTDKILTNWHQTDKNLEVSEFLEVAFDLLAKYKVLAPKILFDGSMNFDVNDFISKCENLQESRDVQIRAVDLFMDLDPSVFKSKTDLFKKVVVLATESYYDSKNVQVFRVLKNLLQNCGIFDGCLAEIDFWVDGFLNLKNHDADVAIFLCDLIRVAEDNVQYHKEVFESKANFSTLVLNLKDFFAETEPSKAVRNYLSFVLLGIFHIQVDGSVFVNALLKFPYLSEALKSYFSNWSNQEVAVITKCRGRLMEQIHTFSSDFLEGSLKNLDLDFYPNQKLHFLQMLVFYLTNLVNGGILTDKQKDNCSKFLTFLIENNTFKDDRCVRTILQNPTLLQNFTFLNSEDFSTKFILDVVKSLKPETIEKYSVYLRKRVVSAITKIFKKSEKYQNIVITTEVLELMNLDYDQCNKLLTKFVASEDNKCFYSVACYCLNRISDLGRSYSLEPPTHETVQELSRFLSILLNNQTQNVHVFSSAFLRYLTIFPHNLESVNVGLFESLILTPEFNKDNLLLCEFLFDRKPECRKNFEQNLDEVCSKRSFILTLLDVVLQHYTDDVILEKIYNKIEPHIVKALQKPQKAGQHFQNRHHSLGILVQKFMKTDKFGGQIQKFETTELFHVYLLKKVYDKVEKSPKVWGNMVMTFVHLIMGLLKQKNGNKGENLGKIGDIVLEFLRNADGSTLSNNESLKTFCKLCLKYGVAGDYVLLQILSEIVHLCLTEEDGKLIFDMLFSHSQFLEVILGDTQKLHLVTLWKTICTKWPQLMDRSHIPVLLASYKATKSESATLTLIKMYESEPDQTKFFDFKPFLWGRAAASHYSVRSDPEKVLWRQPKVSDVLNNLHHTTIVSTINDPSHPNSYDLDFFLPLFSHLLAPENPVPTYIFTRSGALALALTGFRGDKNQRFATCNVLQRFYFHLEGRQSGKDNLLWLRLVEAVCKGVAVLEDFKINNFVGVFLARTALVMTQPTEVMYVPLSQYLAAKDSLDFGTIPELYTFLHSPHVDSKQHKHFILEVIRDGLSSEKDFMIFIKSMGFKLISELCSSTVCEVQTKILVLEIFKKCCGVELGVKFLCGVSFVSQIASLVVTNTKEGPVLVKLLEILLKVVETDTNRHRNFIVYDSLTTLLKSEHFQCLNKAKGLLVFYRVLTTVVTRYPDFFTTEHLEIILDRSKDEFCSYIVRFGCQFVKGTDFGDDQFLRLLIYRKVRANSTIMH